MKKVVFMMAVLFGVTACYAQKSAVKLAKNRAGSSENPDFVGAREAIKPALEDAETKDLADTWYVAGEIGSKQIDYSYLRAQIYGEKLNEDVVCEAAYESYKYWIKADELAMTLVADKKGNMKPAAPKLRQKIADGMVTYYQRQFILSHAVKLNSAGDYAGAYDAAAAHVSIPDLEMMSDPKMQAKFQRDSLYFDAIYLMGRFAYNAKDLENAKKCFTKVLENKAAAIHTDAIYSLEFLADIAKEQKDTAGYIAQLERGFKEFPQEPWFVQNLINFYLQDLKDEQAAMDYVNKAIESDAQLQYFNLRGELYIRSNKFDEAIAEFEALIQKDASYAMAYNGLGRAHYFKAYQAEEKAQDILDNKQFDKAMAAAKAMYRPAVDPLKKALELDPEDRNAAILLKNAYFKLGMHAESKAVQETYGL